MCTGIFSFSATCFSSSCCIAAWMRSRRPTRGRRAADTRASASGFSSADAAVAEAHGPAARTARRRACRAGRRRTGWETGTSRGRARCCAPGFCRNASALMASGSFQSTDAASTTLVAVRRRAAESRCCCGPGTADRGPPPARFRPSAMLSGTFQYGLKTTVSIAALKSGVVALRFADDHLHVEHRPAVLAHGHVERRDVDEDVARAEIVGQPPPAFEIERKASCRVVVRAPRCRPARGASASAFCNAAYSGCTGRTCRAIRRATSHRRTAPARRPGPARCARAFQRAVDRRRVGAAHAPRRVRAPAARSSRARRVARVSRRVVVERLLDRLLRARADAGRSALTVVGRREGHAPARAAPRAARPRPASHRRRAPSAARTCAARRSAARRSRRPRADAPTGAAARPPAGSRRSTLRREIVRRRTRHTSTRRRRAISSPRRAPRTADYGHAGCKSKERAMPVRAEPQRRRASRNAAAAQPVRRSASRRRSRILQTGLPARPRLAHNTAGMPTTRRDCLKGLLALAASWCRSGRRDGGRRAADDVCRRPASAAASATCPTAIRAAGPTACR